MARRRRVRIGDWHRQLGRWGRAPLNAIPVKLIDDLVWVRNRARGFEVVLVLLFLIDIAVLIVRRNAGACLQVLGAAIWRKGMSAECALDIVHYAQDSMASLKLVPLDAEVPGGTNEVAVGRDMEWTRYATQMGVRVRKTSRLELPPRRGCYLS